MNNLAIIFDWGSVIGISNTRRAAKILGEKHDIDPERLYYELDSREDEYSKGDKDTAPYYKWIEDNFRIPVTELKGFLNPEINKKVYKLAKDLSDKYPVYILSNQMAPMTEAIKKETDLSFFKEVFFSSDIGKRKPEMEIYEYTIKKIGIDPDDCVFIDDRQVNLDPAKKLGMKTVLYVNFNNLLEELRNLEITW